MTKPKQAQPQMMPQQQRQEVKVMPDYQKLQELPDFITMLLAGADVDKDKNEVEVKFCGEAYYLHSADYMISQQIADTMKKEYLVPRGYNKTQWNMADAIKVRMMSLEYLQKTLTFGDTKRLMWLLGDTQGCGFYRAIQPASFITAHTKKFQVQLVQRFNMMTPIFYDAIVIQRNVDRQAFDYLYKITKKLKEIGKKIIFECDDDLATIPKENPFYGNWITDRGIDRLNQWSDLADVLIVSTEQLKEVYAKKYPKKPILVMPNFIDSAMWDKVTPKEPHKDAKNNGARIIWAGSPAHKPDWAIVHDAFAKLAQEFHNVHFIFMGYTPEDMGGIWKNKYTSIEWVDMGKYAERFSHLGAEIAVAPVQDIAFNRSKSNVKFLEASMCKLPMVASDIVAYKDIKHGETGFLAKDGEWYQLLRELIVNPTMRQVVGENSYKFVKEKYEGKQIAVDFANRLHQTLFSEKVG